MCSMLGITHIYTQPYHNEANGRAERAGQQIMEVFKKLHTDNQVNWVETLPRVIDRIHDTPGESGLSPYEIVFGRERFCANVPYNPPRECEDAQYFFKRMNDLDQRVARILNAKHQKEAKQVNVGRKDLKPLQIGRVVWYRRPEGSAGKLDTRWVGPCEMITREGEFSYVIKTAQGGKTKAHRSFLKEYEEDTYSETPKPMFFHQRMVLTPQTREKQLRVKSILNHAIEEDGSYKFLTQREGQDITMAEWLSPQDFLAQAGQTLIQYCQEHGLKKQVQFLAESH